MESRGGHGPEGGFGVVLAEGRTEGPGKGTQVFEVPEEIKKLYGGGDWHMAYI